MGYIAEAAAAAGAVGGCPQHLLQRLQVEAGLAGSAAAEALLWKVVPAVGKEQGLTAIKKALPDDVSYGQIKVMHAGREVAEACKALLLHQSSISHYRFPSATGLCYMSLHHVHKREACPRAAGGIS